MDRAIKIQTDRENIYIYIQTFVHDCISACAYTDTHIHTSLNISKHKQNHQLSPDHKSPTHPHHREISDSSLPNTIFGILHNSFLLLDKSYWDSQSQNHSHTLKLLHLNLTCLMLALQPPKQPELTLDPTASPYYRVLFLCQCLSMICFLAPCNG